MNIRSGNIAALLAAGSMALPPPALAGGACYSGARSYGYAAPSYGHGYQATSYAAPAYYAPQVVVQQALVPAYSFQVLTAYESPRPAKVVQAPPKLDDQALEAIAERVVQRIAPALTTAVAPPLATPSPQSGWALEDEAPWPPSKGSTPYSAPTKAPPPYSAPAKVPPYPAPPPPVANPQSSAPARDRGPSGFDQAAIDALGAACYRCHSPSEAKGKIALFDASGRWSPARTDGGALDPAEVLAAVESPDGASPPAMPKGATHDRSTWLGPTAVAALERWAQGG